jgi:recombination protein RecT
MANDLIVLEGEFTELAPRFEKASAGRLPAPRLIQSVLVSCEKTPRLLQCTRQSLFNAAMSAAILALEVDGITGQGFIIPYNIKGTLTAQFQVGYKGANTLGARAGYSITAGTVREGDLVWDYLEGSGGYVHHKRKLNNKGPRRGLLGGRGIQILAAADLDSRDRRRDGHQGQVAWRPEAR